MGSSIRDQVEWLFTGRGECLKEIAVVFARGHGKWLTMREIINQVGKNYSNSTIYNNFKKLSMPMSEVDNHNYINTEFHGTGCKPALRGKLSDAAFERLFSFARHTREKPPSKILKLCGIGQVEIPPLSIGSKNVSPEEMISLNERKVGKERTHKRMRKMVNDKPGFEKAATQKQIEQRAQQDQQYTTRSRMRVSEHLIGPFPKRVRIADIGLIDLFAYEYPITVDAEIYLVDSSQDDARVRALEESAKAGEQAAINDLIQVLLNDPSEYARQFSASSLGRSIDSQAIDPLTEAMLNDEHADVRSSAAKALSVFGYREEFAAALEDLDPIVRLNVACVMERLNDFRAVGPLVTALQDSDIRVKSAAAQALGIIGDAGAIDSLTSLFECESKTVRHAASTALGNIKDPRAIQALRKACNDPSGEIRDAIGEALEKLEKRTI